jgi:hypothetical protein
LFRVRIDWFAKPNNHMAIGLYDMPENSANGIRDISFLLAVIQAYLKSGLWSAECSTPRVRE